MGGVVAFRVMPDLRSLPRTLIRGHPGVLKNTGFRLEFIPMKIGAGMTILIEAHFDWVFAEMVVSASV